MREPSLIEEYIKYTSGGEVPVVFNRWAMIGGIAACLERNVFYPFGYGHINPNMYLMLLGSSGTKKSTTIKLVKKLMQQSGYETFAPERTTKEKFMLDLAAQSTTGMDADDILSQNLFGESGVDASAITPCMIAADEANDFFGINNMEFLSILGSLWDWDGKYENRTKADNKVIIPNPTLTILSGNTPTNFATAFPPTIFGQGFFSRLLLIHGEPNGNKVPRPRPPDQAHTTHIIESISRLRKECHGEIKFTETANSLIDAIYLNYKTPNDPRFESYGNRRQTHLIKIIMAVAASHYTTFVNEDIVIEANTILSFAEQAMPKALGAFGAARDAEVVNKVLTLVNKSDGPVQAPEIWEHIHRDLSRASEFQDILTRLQHANQIQIIPGVGIAPVKRSLKDAFKDSEFVDVDAYITAEEMRMNA